LSQRIPAETPVLDPLPFLQRPFSQSKPLAFFLADFRHQVDYDPPCARMVLGPGLPLREPPPFPSYRIIGFLLRFAESDRFPGFISLLDMTARHEPPFVLAGAVPHIEMEPFRRVGAFLREVRKDKASSSARELPGAVGFLRKRKGLLPSTQWKPRGVVHYSVNLLRRALQHPLRKGGGQRVDRRVPPIVQSSA